MRDALRFEWTRIRTVRSTYWLVGISLIVSVGIALIIGLTTSDDARDEITDAGLVLGAPPTAGLFLSFLPIIMAIMGILAVGHEYRYGTIQPTLTALPQRSQLLVAKVLMASSVAVLTAAVGILINIGIGALVWGEVVDLTRAPLDEVIPGYFAMVILYTTLGAALAQLFRGIPSAIVVLLVTPLLVEQVITGLATIDALDWLVPVVKFLPFAAGDRLVEYERPMAAMPGGTDFEIFERWASGGVFAAFVAIILAVAWFLFQKRDA